MAKSIKTITKRINKLYPTITAEEYRGCVRLTGELDSWDEIVKVGKSAVTHRSLGVLNDVKLKGYSEKVRTPSLRDFRLDGKDVDVMIIGAGAVGSAIARELSRYAISVLMVDKESDIGMGQSSRNNGDIRVNLDVNPNQHRYAYSVKGKEMFDRIAEELSIDFKHTGRLVFFANNKDKMMIPKLKRLCKKLGNEVEFVKGKKLSALEPSIPSWNKGAFYIKTGGEICPYQYTIALAENAVLNGVELSLNTIVEGMSVEDGYIKEVQTNRGAVKAKIVINASGVMCDKIADMAGDRTFTIHPKKNTMLVLDKKKTKVAPTSCSRDKQGKGIGNGVYHTIHGNLLLVGEDEEVPSREDTSTTMKAVGNVFADQNKIAQEMGIEDIITYFAGISASNYEEDFVIRKGIFTKNIIEVAAIQLPGLTASPAIAEKVAEWTIEMLGGAKENFSFQPYRKGLTKIKEMTEEERNKFIKSNPDFGVIVCHCEEISRGEIIEAATMGIPATTLDGVKRRVRAGMGRCQGGHCAPIVLDILSKTTGVPMESINKSTENSQIVFGDSKGGSNGTI